MNPTWYNVEVKTDTFSGAWGVYATSPRNAITQVFIMLLEQRDDPIHALHLEVTEP